MFSNITEFEREVAINLVFLGGIVIGMIIKSPVLAFSSFGLFWLNKLGRR